MTWRRGVLLLLLVGLSLGAFATEVTTAIALGAALVAGDRRAMREPAGPLLALGFAFALAAPGGGLEAWREVLGRVWPLAPLLVVPALVQRQDRRVEAVALGVAGLVAAAAVVERLWTLAPTVSGPFSHHLTLGYALLPAFGLAVARRRHGLAAALLAGLFAAGGSGPLLSAVVVGAAVLLLAPGPALALGAAGALAAFVALLGASELHERAVLWAAGAQVALDAPVGVGPTGQRDALAIVQAGLEPGFFFPLHAHDSALQLGVLVGLGGWIALVWLGLQAWRRADRTGRAILAGLAVGSLTQDVLGDLEVARAGAAWLAWCALPAPDEPAAPPAVGPSHPSPRSPA